MHTKRSRGKRGGHSARNVTLRDIHSKIDGLPCGHNAGHAHNLHGTSATAAILDRAAQYFDGALIEERAETHVIPRMSLTRKQLLGVKPQEVELSQVPCKQRDKQTGNEVTTTDNRVVWKSDRTLLRLANPFVMPKDFKREGSVSVGNTTRKYIQPIPEVPVEDPNEKVKIASPVELDVNW
jgi:hypothetical protein